MPPMTEHQHADDCPMCVLEPFVAIAERLIALRAEQDFVENKWSTVLELFDEATRALPRVDLVRIEWTRKR